MNFETFESMFDLNHAAQRLHSHGDDGYAGAVEDAIEYITEIESNEIEYQVWTQQDFFGEYWFWDEVDRDDYDAETDPDKKRKMRRVP